MAAEEYVLERVMEGRVGVDRIPVWHVIYTKPDGSKHHHTIPKMAINWRMAEYELDTVDEAIDWVLHEGWAVDPANPNEVRPDPAREFGMVTRMSRKSPELPMTLMTAPSIAQAREAQRMRIEDAKTRRKAVKPKKVKGASGAAADPVDPLDVMRQTHIVSVEDVQDKRLRVRAARQGMGLDKNQPSAWAQLMKARPDPEKPFDTGMARRELDRRMDRSDPLFAMPLPKELRDFAGLDAGDVRPALERAEADARKVSDRGAGGGDAGEGEQSAEGEVGGS